MKKNRILLQKLNRALQAIIELFEREFADHQSLSWNEALEAKFEITQTPIPRRLIAFHRRFVPLRKQMVELLATTYRAFFKVALAHESQTGIDPDVWAQVQFQPAIELVLNWIPGWYVLACDGENESVRHHGSVPFTPGQTVSLSIPIEIDPHPTLKSWRAHWPDIRQTLVGFQSGGKPVLDDLAKQDFSNAHVSKACSDMWAKTNYP
jgi:hypothetical protein